MENLSQLFISITPIIFLILTFLIFSIFRLFRPIMKYFKFTEARKQFITRYLPVSELIIWIIFLGGMSQYYYYKEYPLLLAPAIIFTAILFFLAWFALKDVIAGIVTKTSGHIKVHDIITVSGFTGRVIQLSYTHLLVEDNSGKVFTIPYSTINPSTIVRHSSSQTLLPHTFLFACNNNGTDAAKITEQLKKEILILPWASQKKEPRIVILEETDKTITFRITIFSVDESFLWKTSKWLEERFSGRVVSETEENLLLYNQ